MLITGAYRNREVLLSPDNNYNYVIIPKNASTWTIKYLTGGWGWTWYSSPNTMSFKTTNNDHIKYLVILRDPIDRWCSGVTQLFWDISKDYDWVTYVENMSKQKLFNKIQYDEHTELQCNFLHNIDTSQCVFFYIDEYYEKTFRKFCHITFIGQYNNNELENLKNSSSNDDRRYKVKQLLRSYCEYPIYSDLIYDFYRKDYELINSVEFYGKNSS